MKSHKKLLLLLVLLACGLQALPAQAQRFWKDLEFPPLASFEVPEVEQYTLDNGIRVFLLPDPTLPKVDVQAVIQTGSLWEDPSQAGLAGIVGQVMRTGGTKKFPGDQLNEALEDRGATLESSIGEASGSASLFVLTEDTEFGLEALADLLSQPQFPEDKIELAKIAARDAISRRNDDVAGIVAREFNKLIYGADSAYARQVEYSTIEAIQREDLSAFHQRFFVPSNVMVGVVGDFQSEKMKDLLSQTLGKWEAPAKQVSEAEPKPEEQQGPQPAVKPEDDNSWRKKTQSSETKQAVEKKGIDVPAFEYEWRNAVYLVTKTDVNQSQFAIGHLGGRRDAPDYYALVMMSEILGSGGFSSRLLNEVRTKRGLGYFASGRWSANYLYPGTFVMRGGTRSDATVESIQVFVETLRGMLESPPTAEEMKQAREGILNSFVFNFDTRNEVVGRLMRYEYFGYPADTLQRFKEGIEKVTAEDVQKAARENLRPDQLVYLIVGNPADFSQPLTELGAGEPIPVSIEIPSLPTEPAPAADEAALEKGAQLWAKVREAHGGAEQLASVESVRSESSLQLQTPGGPMTAKAKALYVFPDLTDVEMELPIGKIRQILTAESLVLETPQGEQTMPGSAFQAAKRERDLDILPLLKLEAPVVQWIESREGEGAKLEVLRVHYPDSPDLAANLEVNPENHRVLRKIFQGGGSKPGETIHTYSDWREVEGVLFPFQTSVTQGGKPLMEATLQSVEVNPEQTAQEEPAAANDTESEVEEAGPQPD